MVKPETHIAIATLESPVAVSPFFVFVLFCFFLLVSTSLVDCCSAKIIRFLELKRKFETNLKSCQLKHTRWAQNNKQWNWHHKGDSEAKISISKQRLLLNENRRFEFYFHARLLTNPRLDWIIEINNHLRFMVFLENFGSDYNSAQDTSSCG